MTATDLRSDQADQTTDRGVVGDRHLVGVQTFDIARLTTHAVPIVPGTFVAVAGRGPKGDSNGSGKTSSLAAISLLLADPQWRLETNGGKWAAGLLFKPDAAGLEAGQHYPAASFGYIVGVFARHADHRQRTSSTDLLDPLTVWVRVAPTVPYVEARWQEGLHVADGATDLERVSQADLTWVGLPTGNRSSARRMAELLYGTAPRCLSYLDTPLRKHSPSLLSQQMTEMTPEQIGESLIALAGLTEPIEREEQQRSEVADHQRRLAQAEADDVRLHAGEEADLAGVTARQDARAQLAEGERMWRLHFAKGYLDVLAEDEVAAQRLEDATVDAAQTAARAQRARDALAALAARTDLGQAARDARAALDAAKATAAAAVRARDAAADTLRALATERAGLLPARDGWSGASVEQAAAALHAAQALHLDATIRATAAEQTLRAAEEHLRRTRAGRDGETGRAVDALEAAGIQAVAVLDVVEVVPWARAGWEPRLWPHRHAVAVAPADRPAALEVLARSPGAELVTADAPLGTPPAQLPRGVRCSAPLAGFLLGLEQRHPHRPAPDRAEDPPLGRAVLGGFDQEIAGRAARLASAQSRLAAARQEHAQALQQVQGSNLRVEGAQADLDAARAAERLDQITRDQGALQGRLPALEASRTNAEQAASAAEDAWADARGLAANHTALLEAATAKARLRDSQAQRARQQRDGLQRAREGLRLGYWRDGWQATPDAARQALAAETEPERGLSAKRLRNRAAEALRDALRAYGITNPEDAPDDDLAEVVRRREQFADGFGGVGGDTVDFESLARPLRNRLDGLAETDQITDSQVHRQRQAREAALTTLRNEVGERAGTLQRLQDMIERLIERHLAEVGDAFNRLDLARDGYGAALRVTSQRPDGPTDQWRWRTIPCWRRSPSGPMTIYREVANGAQVKVHAIQLVLAALLASGQTAGRVLVLDELGNSLGDVNKRDVLGSLKQVAGQQRVTILGTCQDSVLEAAAGFCGEVLWYTHVSDADPYNQPTRVWAFDEDGARVELTADWVRSARGHV